ncbi:MULTISPECIES: flagellar hook-basal body protein [Bacillus]|uniref:Flagellar hook-basal body protein n=1 Tax=Bacillus smithii 7_3_47FAA TaxID=665952 RepID=G9QJ65_9BACI|nr:flagellar hook-basal body protein [Bacillus smithii]EHL78797.1 flagellar hook-basal body protein [Bacillus smithii 7_3_47FAA]
MNRIMINATNTLGQLQKQLDVISNNLANADTNGFKSREATFSDLLVQQFQNQLHPNSEMGRMTPEGIRLGTGAKLAQTKMNTKLGPIQTTGRSLDLALTNENQYFKVLVQENGREEIRFTRNGAFYLSPVNGNQVMLVTAEGYPVLDEQNRPVQLNRQAGQNITVDKTGRLSVGGGQAVNLGIVSVERPQYLEQKGNNLLGLPADSTVAIGEVARDLTGALRSEISVQQGALEKSNVDISKEMTDMINVQRSYQFQSRSVTLGDQMMGLVNSLR